MAFEQACLNMITQQLRTCQILDETLLTFIKQTPRAHFVPKPYERLAYADTQIPLGHAQTMMMPVQEATMLQALSIQPSDKILEIGTGSGYVTALLSQMGRHVTSVDIFPEFVESAAEKLRSLNLSAVDFTVRDAARGFDNGKSFDVIVITGSLPYLPPTFKKILNTEGRLFAIVGKAPVMRALKITRVDSDQWIESNLFETDITPLINAFEEETFVF